MKRRSIFNRFLLLIIIVIIIPMILIYAVSSSVLIANLHSNYNDTVNAAAYSATRSIRDVVRSVIDTSVSVVGNVKIREFLTCDKENDNYLELHRSAKNSVETYYVNNNYISHIQIMSIQEDRNLSTDSKNVYSFKEEEKERMKESQGTWFWTHESNGKVSIYRIMRNVNNVSEKLGYIKIVLNEESIERKLLTNDSRIKFNYFLLDMDSGELVISSDIQLDDMVKEIFQGNQKRIKQDSGFVLQKDNQYVVFTELGIKSLTLVTVAKDQSMYYTMMKYGIILLFIILFTIAAGLYAGIYRKHIAVPLMTLSSHMKQLNPESGVPLQVDVEAEGEVKELVDTFNAMSNQLDYLYETNYKNELKLRDANLLLLNSEMNPHFLYNVLDSVRWMVEMDQKEAATGMIQNLSEMFRLSLELSESSVISLGKELEHVEKYVSIEKYRFRDKIHIQMNIQDNIQHIQVIKFILQPLIENALVHGISKFSGYGNVLVSVYLSGDELVYDVRDDGGGADPERIQQILNSTLIKQNSLEGFALENIQARLHLRYGEEYGIVYHPREGGGSIFIVKQPVVT